uniref:Anaphase-promoting complex subunit 4-like WD40 domain-containing protein n=1 Tax=Trypanosoma congolense (strain IL3000) TaxID=1068625 RepID=G0V0K1_TRYCI|nr:conserved hypothetical protein [Trypanosoma congolense IL3000]
MKILHTRAAAEPILLATACHNMNLLAIVTRSVVVVYRSTTLTVVTQLSLSIPAEETSVSACWSPSGRILAIGLQSGEVFLLDVESGDLVRKFVSRFSSKHFCTSMEDSDDCTSVAFEGGSVETEKEPNGVGNEEDPLRQPPVLSTSTNGAIVACTWTSAVSRVSTLKKHSERCLPLCTTASSCILDELQCGDETPVLILFDQAGGLSFLPGGIREVCFVSTKLPFLMDLSRVRVDSFVVAAPPPALRKESKDGDNFSATPLDDVIKGRRDRDNGVNTSHVAYLVVNSTAPNNSLQIVRLDLSEVIASVTSREVVSVCCIAEYCRMGKKSFLYSLKQWSDLICNVHTHMLLPDNATLLRDAVVEELAHPEKANVLNYFNAIDLKALIECGEDISRMLTQLVLQVSNVVHRCYDIALHVSQTQCRDLKRQSLLLEIIGGLRQRCGNVMREIRYEAEREKELLQWVIQRRSLVRQAPPATADTLTLDEPLRARLHPMLLRTLHRIGKGESVIGPPVAKESDKVEKELTRVVESFMPLHSGVPVAVVPLLYDGEDVLRVHQCEVIAAGPADTADGILLRVAAVSIEQPVQVVMGYFSLKQCSRVGFAFQQEKAWVPLEVQPLQFTIEEDSLHWSALVDDDGHCVVLWRNKPAPPSASTSTFGAIPASLAENILTLSLVDEDGRVAVQNDCGDESPNGNTCDGGDDDTMGCDKTKYAVLEVKGISTRHLKASVSRSRGFGVFYAMERFVVVDFYGG